jgi:hypothetical protein
MSTEERSERKISDEELFEQASRIADQEAADLPSLIADLKQARESLASVYNRLARSVDPTLCVVQGRVETAQETIDVALDLVEGQLR